MSNGAARSTVTTQATGHALPAQPPSDSVYLAALMLCGRWYYRQDAPLGIAGSDLGGIYVSRRDPDVAALLRGKRTGQPPSAEQRWPTVAEVRDRFRIGSEMEDERIAEVIAAVVEQISGIMARPFGFS